ncbi:MAG: RNA-binding S4 domain-containing protein, partial [Gammaproteobacteria bacterium]
MMPKHNDDETTTGMRLDKWLWCARFYKTRTLAAAATKNGRVLVNAARVKPSKLIHPGSWIRISRAPYLFDITVVALAGNRKSAAAAALLYSESRESIALREQVSSRLKVDALYAPG